MLTVDREVVILIGPFKGRVAKIKKISFDEGAARGWFQVICDGVSLMFAGEELSPVRKV